MRLEDYWLVFTTDYPCEQPFRVNVECDCMCRVCMYAYVSLYCTDKFCKDICNDAIAIQLILMKK